MRSTLLSIRGAEASDVGPPDLCVLRNRRRRGRCARAPFDTVMVSDTRREDRLMGQTYASYNLPQLWQMVAGENSDAGHSHVATLDRLRAALDQHCNNLRARRDQLVEGWPPERSAAAAAFV